MKLLKTTLIASALMFGAIGAASAANPGSIPGVNGNVNVVVNNGVATVFGHVDSSFESTLITRNVAAQDGVDRVINLVSFQ